MVSRHELLTATGSVGAFGLARYTAPMNDNSNAAVGTNEAMVTQMSGSGLSYTSPLGVMRVNGQGGQAALRSTPVCRTAHPLEIIDGPVELPQVWAFSVDDGELNVLGPILRTTEGNDMEVILDNTDGIRLHTVHSHDVCKAWRDGGVPTTMGIRVSPDEKHTYATLANVPGTYFYRCHYQTHRHAEVGMHGTLHVDPKRYEPADQEYFMTVCDWNSWLPWQVAGRNATYDPRDWKPDVFTVSGESAPRTFHPEDSSPVIVEQGDTVRVHYVDAGCMSHPMRIHNHRFQVVEKGGGAVLETTHHNMDVTNIASAERYTIGFTTNAQSGIHSVHCHKVSHIMNGSFYPGGMLSGVIYEGAMDTDIFASLMEYAGYKG